jgi:hypothetical protein
MSEQGVAEGSGGVSVRQWANQVRKDHGADVKFRNRQEGSGAVDSVIAKNSNGETVGVYNRKTGYPTVYEPKQGVAEGSYDYVKRGKELDAATKRVQSNLDRRIKGKELDAATKSRIRGKELDAATKRVQSNLDRRIKKLDQGVAEGNYDRDDYYNARQGREYGKGLTATGYGGDGSKTRRDDIFKGQSKRLPADPFARTTGAVPKTGTGRIHSNALPGEMDEANDQKIGGRYDADEFDSMVSRLKKLAGAGPMKTVYDPDRRVYRNMPTAVQPKQQDKK